MKAMTIKRSSFKLAKFVAALHRFDLQNFGSGNPLPAVSGDTVYHDPIELIEELNSIWDEELETIPDDSLQRLEMGLELFATFAVFNGESGFNCADGKQIEVPHGDHGDDEPAIANTAFDENTCFGFLISLGKNAVVIEAKEMRDVSGESRIEKMLKPNLLADAMRLWVESFVIRKK
jgi:hypothetical protein